MRRTYWAVLWPTLDILSRGGSKQTGPNHRVKSWWVFPAPGSAETLPGLQADHLGGSKLPSQRFIPPSYSEKPVINYTALQDTIYVEGYQLASPYRLNRECGFQSFGPPQAKLA